MKGLIITAFSLFLFGAAQAQDNRADNDDNGVHEATAQDGSPMPAGGHYHMDRHWNHVQTIALSPFQYSENGVGAGLSYERALDPEGIISVYVPFIATFNLNKNRDYYNGNYYNNSTNNNNVMFYAMPGIKFYPTGMGRVKYAVGPNAVIGVGQHTYNYYDNNNYYYGYVAPNNYTVSEDRFLFGMMINNSLNINPTPHLYIGAEMGFGFTYFDRINNVNRGVTFLTQGAFKIGYTF